MASPATAEDGVTATEIVIGSHTALSGPVSVWGTGAAEAARMRFNEANEKGIHGRKIRWIVEDNGWQVPRAVQAANKLLNNDKIFLMLNALGTPMNNAVFADQFAKGVPSIFPFSLARSMSEPLHPLKFALFSTYYDQVRATAKHFLEKEKKSKLCTMYLDTEFGHEIRDGVRDQAKASKVEIASEATYGPQDIEFFAPITRLKSAGCDVVIMGSIIRDTIQSVGTAKKLGWNDVVFVGQTASYDPIVAGAPGGVMEGYFSATGYPYAYPDTSSDAIKAWFAKYKDKAKQEANSSAQFGYVSADIVVKVLDAAGKDLTRAKFLAALESLEGYQPFFPGPALNFSATQHQGSNVTFLAKVEGGRWKIVADNLHY